MKRRAMDIILASGSPRRRELLARAQLDFRVLSVDIDETPLDKWPADDTHHKRQSRFCDKSILDKHLQHP